MGRALGLSTYPKLVNEVGALASEKYIHIVELIKHAVESLTVRGAFKGNTRYGNESNIYPEINAQLELIRKTLPDKIQKHKEWDKKYLDEQKKKL